MHFKNGDLAIVVGGPWQQAIGKIVKVIWKCRSNGRTVSADGLQYYMSADGPVYLVRTVNGSTLPAGYHPKQALHQLKRRPICGCHLRPLVDVSEGNYLPARDTVNAEAEKAAII